MWVAVVGCWGQTRVAPTLCSASRAAFPAIFSDTSTAANAISNPRFSDLASRSADCGEDAAGVRVKPSTTFGPTRLGRGCRRGKGSAEFNLWVNPPGRECRRGGGGQPSHAVLAGEESTAGEGVQRRSGLALEENTAKGDGVGSRARVGETACAGRPRSRTTTTTNPSRLTLT